MNRNLKIIHIEDVKSDAELVDWILKKSKIPFEMIVVDTREDYQKFLVEFQPDIILSDHLLPSFNSLEALNILKRSGLNIPFILITSTVSEEFAVAVMKEGASDYVLKDRLQRLPNAIINAIEKFESDNERNTYLNKIVESEALFSKAELIAEFGTWRFDIHTKALNWSAGNYPLLGHRNGEVEPSCDSFLKNILRDDLEQVSAVFKGTGNLQPAELDFRIKNRDESIRYIHSQYEPELNERNEPVSIIGFNQDVTRSKLAQIEIQNNLQEIKAAAERQSAILNALPPNIVLLNAAGKIVAVNDSWKNFTLQNNLGVPKYGIDYSYIAISEKATGVDQLSGKKIAEGIKGVITGDIDEFSLEYSCYLKNTKIWFQIIVAPLTDKTTKGAVVLHIDITERKLAEELMLQSEANLKTIFENTDIAYVLCNAENKVVSFNTKANDLCIALFDKKLKAGNIAFGYFPKNKIPNIKDAIHKVLNNEKVNYETSYNLKDGTIKWLDVRWAGVANEKNKNIGFILAFKDITRRKVADIERDRMTTDLVQRYKDLEQFTYIVSHNLRAPVANIIGLSDMLNSSDFDVTDNDEVLASLSTSINILDQTIMDLNHILQVRSNISEKNEKISLLLLTEDIRKSLNSLIEKENVVIKSDFTACDTIVSVKSYIHSIFYNLILNGIKYRRTEIAPVITIYSRRRGNKLEISFKDNGKGIDEKNFKNLFGLYKRFDTSVEGKGMGLFMVNMQAENLGGKINVQSELGKGSVFKLELPVSICAE
jgi:PAS domain S-box-containing protein